MSDYQSRYMAHRKRKAQELSYDDSHDPPSVAGPPSLSRRSRRRFADRPIPDAVLTELLSAIANAPSSCNRSGIKVQLEEDPAEWESLLVGGEGWIGKAAMLVLLWADDECYQHHDIAMAKTLADQDGAFAAAFMHARACEIGIASCFICPNLRGQAGALEDLRFVGAVALGYPLKLVDSIGAPPKRSVWDLLIGERVVGPCLISSE